MKGVKEVKELALVRIDDRLIHGQVITSWIKVTNVNTILIVDDEVSKDEFLSKILKMAAPKDIKVKVLNTIEAIEYLFEETPENIRIMILVKKPETIYEMQKNGIDIKEINLGGIGAKIGRKKLYKNISISEEEREIFKKMLEINTKITIRIVPDDKEISINQYL